MASTGATLGSAGERGGLAAEEARLARRAAGGDGESFATLYDRYESRVYNFCHRLLGSPDDAADATQEAFLKVLQRLPSLEGRELNFGAYLFTAARNASYDMIGKRKRAHPVDELPERGGGEGAREPGDLDLDPERTAMLGDLQERVRAANGRLPERQREVLALRELQELSYDEIAAIMDMNRNSVAQLISRARIKLRDELRGSALASVAASSPDCERALPLIAARADGQLAGGPDAGWLEAHLEQCERCRVSEEAMEEAGRSYRGWIPLVPLLWLRRETIARAGDLVGSDWRAIVDAPRPGGAGPEGGGSEGGGSEGGGSEGGVRRLLGSRRRGVLALLAALALLLGVLAAIVVGDEGSPPDSPDPAVAEPAAGGAAPAGGKAGRGKPAGKPSAKPGGVIATTTPTGVVTTTGPASGPAEAAPGASPPGAGQPTRRRTARRRSGTGSRPGTGSAPAPDTSGGPVADPAPAPTSDPPPPTTTSEPPPTTSEPPPCRPGIVPCPRSAGGSTEPAR